MWMERNLTDETEFHATDNDAFECFHSWDKIERGLLRMRDQNKVGVPVVRRSRGTTSDWSLVSHVTNETRYSSSSIWWRWRTTRRYDCPPLGFLWTRHLADAMSNRTMLCAIVSTLVVRDSSWMQRHLRFGYQVIRSERYGTWPDFFNSVLSKRLSSRTSDDLGGNVRSSFWLCDKNFESSIMFLTVGTWIDVELDIQIWDLCLWQRIESRCIHSGIL